jgi:hypothetical protein
MCALEHTLKHAQARTLMHVRARAHAQARSSTRTNFVCATALYDEEEEVTKTPYENYA